MACSVWVHEPPTAVIRRRGGDARWLSVGDGSLPSTELVSIGTWVVEGRSAMTIPGRSADLDSGRLLSARRALISLLAGLATGVMVGLLAAPRLLPLVSWTVTVAVLLTWVWRQSWPQDSDGTKRLAEQESTTRSSDVWLLAAAVASLAVVVLALVQSSSQRNATAVASVLLSVLSVALSWALVNTVYAFKYARLYYLDEPDIGGIDFKQEDPPTYSDFAYLAFTVGMSFAVSETEPTSTHIRRVALGHALLSYAFGTGILAVAINLVTNLGQ